KDEELRSDRRPPRSLDNPAGLGTWPRSRPHDRAADWTPTDDRGCRLVGLDQGKGGSRDRCLTGAYSSRTGQVQGQVEECSGAEEPAIVYRAPLADRPV